VSDNKLNLLVKFTGIDKLSGGIRNIIGASRSGSQSIRTLQDRARDLKREIKQVGRDMQGASGNVSALVDRQSELERQLAETNGQLDRQKERLERIGRIESRFSGIAKAAGKAGAAASLAVTTPLVAFGRNAFIAAMDAEELRSAFNVTFGKNGAMMEAWAARTGAAVGRTNVELMQAANTFGIFFNQADPAKSAGMSQQFAMLAQDLASFYNTDPGTALDKLRSGLTGESEPLRDFGVFMTDAAVKAQALKMGLKPVGKELSEQQKIMARAGLIMAQTTAAQGDLARTSGSTANQLRASESAWRNMSLIVGQQLIPALTPLIQTFTGIIQKFSTLSPETRKWIVIVGGAVAVLGPLLVGVASVAGAIATLAPLVAGVGAVFSVAALPIIAIGAALAGAAYVIYSNWSAISGFFTSTWAAVTGAFTRNWTTIRNIALGALVIFAPFVAAVVWVGAQIYRNWDAIKAATMSMVSAVAGVVQPFIQPFVTIISYISGLQSKFFSFGVNIVSGLINGIVSMAGSVLSAIANLAGSVGAKFAASLGIHSPSRLFMAMGGHISDGLRIGLDQSANRPVRAVGRMAGAVAGAGAMALSPASAGAASAPSPAPVINHFHITQQPGEDANALAERVARLVEQAQRGKRLRGMGDDF
jgi:hypothetical protein